MIDEPTVFILGAGASAPYRFPTGPGLCRAVISGLKPADPMWSDLHTLCNFSENEITAFREALQFSGKSSVDAFLEHRGEFRAIGKAAMAHYLIRCESMGNLFEAEGNWYQYIYQRMNTQLDRFLRNAVAFITYNYDRSLEQYLFTAMKNTYNLDDSACTKILRELPIVHLHGCLGYLPWQSTFDVRKFEQNISGDSLQTCINNIKIIHEAAQEPAFDEAWRLMNSAKRIYFLGFGYDEINTRRLGISKIKAEVVAGTAYQLQTGEIRRALAAVGRPIELSPSNYDCLHFLRTDAELY